MLLPNNFTVGVLKKKTESSFGPKMWSKIEKWKLQNWENKDKKRINNQDIRRKSSLAPLMFFDTSTTTT